MESNKIEQLLDKYFESETTLQEEAVLQDYFLNSKVAPHLKEYQALFEYFAKSKGDRYTKTIQLNNKKKNWKWMSIAASVVLLFSVYIGYQHNQNQQRAEAEIAFKKSQKAFELLSKNLNKRTTAFGYLGTYQKTTNKIFKKQ